MVFTGKVQSISLQGSLVNTRLIQEPADKQQTSVMVIASVEDSKLFEVDKVYTVTVAAK